MPPTSMIEFHSAIRETVAAPAPAAVQEELRVAVHTHGERAVLRAMQVSKTLLYRSAAGLNLYPGSLALLREAVPRLRELTKSR